MSEDRDTQRPENIVIRASAGTGKTHQLSTRYLRLLYSNEPVDRVLATTFTRKAAGEIFDRIVERLVEAIEDDARRQELADSLELSALDRATCLELLTRFTRQLHRTRVVTMDAFFAELARMFALDLTLPTNWQIADESLEDTIRRRAIERLLCERGTKASLELVHLLAKGETRRSVDQLINDTVSELFETYRDAKPSGGSAWDWITPGTTPDDAEVAGALADLRDVRTTVGKRLQTGLRPVIAAAEDEDWEVLGKTTLAEKVLANAPYYNKPIDPTIVEPIRCLLARASFMIRLRMKKQLEACYEMLRDYERHYRGVCDEMGRAFFSDIPDALRELDDQRGVLAFRLDARIDHLLLDEFQDTSSGQWNLFRGLAERVMQDQHASLFCVGDVKQAIYAWRNGTSEILNSLDDRYDALTVNSIDTSRRSRPAIIKIVNQIFTEMRRHEGWTPYESTIEWWAANFPRQATVATDTQGYACLRSGGFGDDQLEATLRRAAEIVKELWDAAPQYGIAVLVRRNESVGRVMHHLRSLGVNASEDGGNPLTNSTAVRIILSLMRMADHPYHSAARFHVAFSPLAASLGFTAENWTDNRVALKAAQRLRRDLLNIGYGATVGKYANALAKSCNAMQEKRLQQLVDLAYVFASRATTRTADFVDFVELRRVNDPTAANIRVMTVHQAKGLEFDRVVVTELEKPQKTNKFIYQRDPQTFCPSRISPLIAREFLPAMPVAMRQIAEQDADRRFREELCVLYVALTRAKYETQIVVAPRASTNGKQSWAKNMAGLIQAALGNSPALPGNTIAFETGKRDWYRDLSVSASPPDISMMESQKTNGDPKDEGASADQPLRFAPRQGKTSSRLDSVAPSQLEGDGRIWGSEIFSARRDQAMASGTLMHGWLALVEWIDSADGVPTDEQLQRVAVEQAVKATPELMQRFRDLLNKPNSRALLDSNAYGLEASAWLSLDLSALRVEPLNEHPITAADGQRQLGGSIDRLVVIWDGARAVAADIIDYKTDQVEDQAAAERLANHYAPQLRAYRQAISSMLRLEDAAIRTRLLFTQSDLLVNVVA